MFKVRSAMAGLASSRLVVQDDSDIMVKPGCVKYIQCNFLEIAIL